MQKIDLTAGCIIIHKGGKGAQFMQKLRTNLGKKSDLEKAWQEDAIN